jgi:large subunit ribosomal protein L4
MDITVKTLDGGDAGTLALSDDIFGLDPRTDILHRVVRWQLAKRRAGTHDVKNRAEIWRTGKKLYKQKGTGHARHGSARVAQFRGGGRAFGPVVRSHAHDLPKKVRALGLKHALSTKARNGGLIVIDTASIDAAKTKALKANFAKLGLASALIIDGAAVEVNFGLAARNIPQIDVLPVQGINVYDILRRDTLVLTKAAVDALNARFAVEA